MIIPAAGGIYQSDHRTPDHAQSGGQQAKERGDDCFNGNYGGADYGGCDNPLLRNAQAVCRQLGFGSV